MKPSIEDYFKDIPIDDHPVCEDNTFLHHDLFTDMMIEAACIIDFQKRNFYDVADHDFFLCGYPQSEVKSMGYQFFNEIIHPDDIKMWVKMHNIILKYLYNQDFESEEVRFFAFTIRIKSIFQIRNAPYYIMAEVRLRPVFVNQNLKYGICLFSASAVETSGNLCVYYKGGEIYCEYLFDFKKWINKKMLKFSPQERVILVQTQQGLSRKNIADNLCLSDQTIKNVITKIIKDSNAKKMMQAVNNARKHRLIYQDKNL